MQDVVVDLIMDAINQNMRIPLFQESLLLKNCSIIAHIVEREKQDIMMNQFI